ncbi:MAG: hypothetical protein ABI664_13600 [bacterium]
MQEMSTANEGKHIPFKKEGWGFALFVCMLAIASAGSAYYVHHRTFKQPTDVRFHAAGTQPSESPAH